VLTELEGQLDRLRAQGPQFTVAVGLNGSTDRSDDIALKHGALVGEADQIGYGHGCMAAIRAVKQHAIEVDAYIFFSGDGANVPSDLDYLIRPYQQGADMVIGTRTTCLSNWRRPWNRSLSNVILGGWVSLLAKKRYSDLGPYRIIDRELFERMQMEELTWGWTIEPQILAPALGAKVVEVPVKERDRVAGKQKISGVSVGRSLNIGLQIAKAGWRTKRRSRKQNR